jgi:hypothetical protein
LKTVFVRRRFFDTQKGDDLKFIFRDKNRELTLPVTPSGFGVPRVMRAKTREHPRAGDILSRLQADATQEKRSKSRGFRSLTQHKNRPPSELR